MEGNIKYSLHWYTANKIKPNHQHLPVTQVYVWISTRDHKIVLVSTGPGRWQFPGGHPEAGESSLQTAQREVLEETGLDIARLGGSPSFFGYYVVEERQGKRIAKRYLQLRYLLSLNQASEKLNVFVNEKKDEERKVRGVGIFSLEEACRLISWLSETEELAVFRKLTATDPTP